MRHGEFLGGGQQRLSDPGTPAPLIDHQGRQQRPGRRYMDGFDEVDDGDAGECAGSFRHQGPAGTLVFQGAQLLLHLRRVGRISQLGKQTDDVFQVLRGGLANMHGMIQVVSLKICIFPRMLQEGSSAAAIFLNPSSIP